MRFRFLTAALPPLALLALIHAHTAAEGGLTQHELTLAVGPLAAACEPEAQAFNNAQGDEARAAANKNLKDCVQLLLMIFGAKFAPPEKPLPETPPPMPAAAPPTPPPQPPQPPLIQAEIDKQLAEADKLLAQLEEEERRRRQVQIEEERRRRQSDPKAAAAAAEAEQKAKALLSGLGATSPGGSPTAAVSGAPGTGARPGALGLGAATTLLTPHGTRIQGASSTGAGVSYPPRWRQPFRPKSSAGTGARNRHHVMTIKRLSGPRTGGRKAVLRAASKTAQPAAPRFRNPIRFNRSPTRAELRRGMGQRR